MNILLTGGTGFIGENITHEFSKWVNKIYILTRSEQESRANIQYLVWHPEKNNLPDVSDLEIDVCINLAGAPLAERKWTTERKRAIVNSRVEATSSLIQLLHHMKKQPDLFIQGSAIGIYPSSKSAVYLDKQPTHEANHFLARTVHEWEATAQPAEKSGIRVVYARFGIVLGRDGGSFPLFLNAFNHFLGGRFASGNQWYSWIHILDVVRAMKFIIFHPAITGIVNFTAPHPVQEKKFAKVLGEKLHRPYKIIIPEPLLKLALGERTTVLLSSQRAYPEKLMSEHFDFKFETIKEAIDDLLE